MAGFSTDDLIRSVVESTKTANSALAAGVQDINKSMEQATTLLDSSMQGLRGAIETSKQSQVAQAEIDYKQKKTVEDLQRLYNMDPTQAANEIATSLATATTARAEREKVRAEYDRLNSVDFFSNPLGYLVAQIQLPQVAQKNNALADMEDSALNNIGRKTELLNAGKNTIVANTADAAKAVALQGAEANAQIATAKLEQAQADNIVRLSSTRMQALQLQDKITDNQRSAISTIAQLQSAAETRLMRAEANADREVDRELRRENLRMILEKRKLDAAEEAAMNERLQLVSTSMGLAAPMTLDRIKALTDKDTQNAWLTAATTGRFGGSMQEAVTFYQQKSNLPEVAARGDKSVVTTAQQLDRAGASYVGSYTNAYRAANPMAKPLSNEQAREGAYHLYATDIAQSMGNPSTKADLSSSKWDSTFNPYVAQFTGISKAADTLPQFAPLKNNLLKKQIDTLVSSGAVKGENLTAEQQRQALDSVQKLVLLRQVTPAKAAADISQFLQAATDFNFKANKYNLFALPQQQSYLFSLEGVGRVNLLDPVELERKIALKVTKDMTTRVNLMSDPAILDVMFQR